MKRTIMFLIVIVALFTISSCDRAKETVLKNTIDNSFVSYETFQDLYNTCEKVNTDLGIYKDLPEDDVMFQQFSKAQRMSSMRTRLNGLVEDYNSKSKQWNKSMWKGRTLPSQLNVNQFSNY